MAKRHKPVSGTRGYWPRKRANRIYQPFTRHLPGRGVLGFAAYKIGMTQVSFLDSRKGSPTQGKEVFLPATVLAAPNLVVAGIKAYRRTREGLKDRGTVWAQSLAKELARKMVFPKEKSPPPEELSKKGDVFRLLVHTKPGWKKTPELFEVPVESFEVAQARLGQEVSAGEIFKEGEFVDVKAVSTGKGVQGPVKRFGVIIRTRKAKKKRRHVGTLGPKNVARVRPNVIAEAGQMGFQTRTEFNKQILKISSGPLTPKGGWLRVGELDGPYLILRGSVPGPTKRLVMLRKGLRAQPEQKLELKQVVLDSQQ